MDEEESTALALFFTWDVSLTLWKERGLLEREIRYYEALAAKGVRVTFLTWGDERDVALAEDLHKNIDVLPLYTRLPRPANKPLRAMCSLLAPWAARDVLRKTTFLKTNQMWGGWCAVVAKLCFRKPLIVRTGFELYRFTCQQKSGRWRRGFVRFISALTYRMADRIYLATTEDRDFVVQTFHISTTKIALRPNWIDTDRFKPLPVPEEENAILFVGRLTTQKNIPLLIAAVEGTPFRLDIIGDGDLRVELEEHARAHNAPVRFLGNIPNDRLPDIYNRYPVFVLPSLYEGNPKTLLEAMACGRAVVGTDAEGIRALVRDGENGLLCEFSPDSLRSAMTSLFSAPDLRHKLGDNARRRIEQTHRLETLVARECADYDALALAQK